MVEHVDTFSLDSHGQTEACCKKVNRLSHFDLVQRFIRPMWYFQNNLYFLLLLLVILVCGGGLYDFPNIAPFPFAGITKEAADETLVLSKHERV